MILLVWPDRRHFKWSNLNWHRSRLALLRTITGLLLRTTQCSRNVVQRINLSMVWTLTCWPVVDEDESNLLDGDGGFCWISCCAAACCCCCKRVFSRLASTLTTEYSMNEPKTKTRQVAIQTSMALVNETAGIPRRWPELCVVMVSIVKIPSEIRAGTDSRSIQKDTHESNTTNMLGRNVERT